MKYSGLIGGFAAVFAVGVIICVTYPGGVYSKKTDKAMNIAGVVFAILLGLTMPLAIFLSQNDM